MAIGGTEVVYAGTEAADREGSVRDRERFDGGAEAQYQRQC